MRKTFRGEFLGDIELIKYKIYSIIQKIGDYQNFEENVHDIYPPLQEIRSLMDDWYSIFKYIHVNSVYNFIDLIHRLDGNLLVIKTILERSEQSNKKITNKITKKLYAGHLQENPLVEELRVRVRDAVPLLYQFQAILAERSDKAQQLLKSIQTSGIEIVAYKNNAEIALGIYRFLDEIDKGIFLHLYVPNGRYQEDQLASFLRLFESYLQHVEKLHFSIETRRTLHGQIYEFKDILVYLLLNS